MSNILDDLPNKLKPKNNREKNYAWIISLLISIIGVAFTVGIFWGIIKTKLSYIEDNINQNDNIISSIKKDNDIKFNNIEFKLDKLNNRIDDTNQRIDEISRHLLK